jgi:hypothetical protein
LLECSSWCEHFIPLFFSSLSFLGPNFSPFHFFSVFRLFILYLLSYSFFMILCLFCNNTLPSPIALSFTVLRRPCTIIAPESEKYKSYLQCKRRFRLP